ncbi:MAG: hypothetical protein ACO3EY_03760 [Candidatus Nanopelagicales bacterium]
MKFDELNEDNYILFAIKNYENPQSSTKDDFYEDLKRIKWIKKLLKRYKTEGELKTHLLINHFIVLYNVFGDAATPLLFYKIDKEYWSVLKTFVVYLQRFPEYPKTTIHQIPLDDNCLSKLNLI